MRKRDFSKILIVRLSSLGDVIQTLPVVTAIRRTFPNAKIGWAIDRELGPAIEGHRDIDHIHLCDRMRWGRLLKNPLQWGLILREGRLFIDEIRQIGYDCALDVQGLLKSAVIPFLAAISPRIGFDHGREFTRHFYTERYLSKAEYFNPARMHVDHMMVLTAAIGCDIASCAMSLPEVAPHHRAAVASLLDRARGPSRSLIAIAPATQWKSKQWPPDHWIALMRLLLARTAATVVLIGSSADRALIARLAGAFENAASAGRVLNLAGQTSAPQLYALLERIAVLIAADTAPLHIAGAAGCRLIGLFGATPADRTGPLGSARMALLTATPPLACQPCQQRECPFGTTECMRRLTPEHVLAAVFEALRDSPRPTDPCW
jgi:heptosyltransferase I